MYHIENNYMNSSWVNLLPTFRNVVTHNNLNNKAWQIASRSAHSIRAAFAIFYSFSTFWKISEPFER